MRQGPETANGMLPPQMAAVVLTSRTEMEKSEQKLAAHGSQLVGIMVEMLLPPNN